MDKWANFGTVYASKAELRLCKRTGHGEYNGTSFMVISSIFVAQGNFCSSGGITIVRRYQQFIEWDTLDVWRRGCVFNLTTQLDQAPYEFSHAEISHVIVIDVIIVIYL